MNIIDFKKSWCEYLTPCPYFNKDNDPSQLMVGSYECFNCCWSNSTIKDLNNNKVNCNFKNN